MRNVKRGIKLMVKDKRPQFPKHNRTVRRMAKVTSLMALSMDKTETMAVRCEARREHKSTFTFRIGRTKINTTGFYEKSGKKPIRCKARSK